MLNHFKYEVMVFIVFSIFIAGCITSDNNSNAIIPPDSSTRNTLQEESLDKFLIGEIVQVTIGQNTCNLRHISPTDGSPSIIEMSRNDSTFRFLKKNNALQKRLTLIDSTLLGKWGLYQLEFNGEQLFLLNGQDTNIVLTLTATPENDLAFTLDDYGQYVTLPLSSKLVGTWISNVVTIDGDPFYEPKTLTITFNSNSTYTMFTMFDETTCDGRITIVSNRCYLSSFMFGNGCSSAVCLANNENPDDCIHPNITAEVIAEGDSLCIVSDIENSQYLWHLFKE